MLELKCGEILLATGGKLLSGNKETVFKNISTDSRKIKPGDLFIPIVGEKFDGHDFIDASFDSGASGALTQKDTVASEGKTLIKVENTLKALQDVARFYRGRFRIPVVGVTGSVGKTSTKDMVASVLGKRFNVLKTEGNFNNEIGLPLTLFNLENCHEAAVIEMGMSGFGEIGRLTRIAAPDIAIITNIGMSHIEKLGSRENILKAKLEILEGLSGNGLVVLNGDDDMLSGLKGKLGFRTVFYGMGDGNDYRAQNVKNLGENGTSFNISLGGREYAVHVTVPGIHNVSNALAAIAAGTELGVPVESMIEGIREFSPGKLRLNIISHKGFKIINDTYNASPQSMESAINVLKDIAGNGRTIAVLGDMLEMGDWAPKAHMDVGKFAVSRGVDYIITVGKNAGYIAKGAFDEGFNPENIFSFNENNEAAEFIRDFVADGDVVLVKGSRGMKMEQIVERLTSEK